MSINQSSLNTTRDEVLAYLLDYGFERELSREKIFEIPSEFVSVLPFQAIRCALHNVRMKDADAGWEEEAGDLLFELGAGNGEVDLMNMGGGNEIDGERTFSVSVQGGRFEHELVRRGKVHI